jgi:hypothetical protein
MTQEVFVGAIQSIGSYRGADLGIPYPAYLLRISRDLAIERWRAKHAAGVVTCSTSEIRLQGLTCPQRTQQLLSRARCDEQQVFDCAADWAAGHLAASQHEDEMVLIVTAASGAREPKGPKT